MGSTGTGNFSDYSQRPSTTPTAKNGGASEDDQCGKAFNTRLDDVSRASYYQNHNTVPPAGTAIKIVFNQVRLAAVIIETSEEIGYLPTSFNYLKVCLDSGFSYEGTVSSSNTIPLPSISIDVTPL